MFKEPQPIANETDTIIGPSVKVEGDFVTAGNIIVEGTISGTIRTSKSLKVGPTAKIFANIWSENAYISGEIQGNLNISNTLELTSTGKVFGDIKAAQISMALGGIINGKCHMIDPKNKTVKPEISAKPLKNEEKSDQIKEKKAK